MMRVKLIKMSVTVWHDCQPEFDCVQYTDEPAQDGMFYKDSGRRLSKTAVKLGDVWLEYDGFCHRPFWRALCIIENDGDTGKISSKAVDLYAEAIKLVKWDSVNFIKSVEALKSPSSDEISKIVVDCFNGTANGKKSIGSAEFKESVITAAAEFGSQMAEEKSKDYLVFFGKVINEQIVSLLMGGLPLKIKGDIIEFENEAAMNNAVECIARKIAGDSVVRFFEMEKQQKQA